MSLLPCITVLAAISLASKLTGSLKVTNAKNWYALCVVVVARLLITFSWQESKAEIDHTSLRPLRTDQVNSVWTAIKYFVSSSKM